MSNSIFHNNNIQRIDLFDQRFYTVDNVTYYPSVTHILSYYPKNWGYEDYLKSNGYNADIILQRAGEEGSQTHGLIDRYLKGQEVSWFMEDGKPTVPLKIWEMFIRFTDFWETYKPEIIANETTMFSEKYKLGGTIDIVCKINGKIWLLDAKTSNYIHKTHELQLSAYAAMWDDLNPEHKIDHVGLIHLKAAARGPDKKGVKMQGHNWSIVTYDRPHSEAFKLFQYTYELWKEENKNYKPANKHWPDRKQLKSSITT